MGSTFVRELLQHNRAFVAEKGYEALVTSNRPEKKIVVLSCMDTRLTELLPKALGFKNGDIKLVKNAGGVVVHPFGSIVRSILVAIYEFQVEDVLVIGHHGCGMANLDGHAMVEKALARGIDPSVFETLRYSGIQVTDWLHGFESAEAAVTESIEALRKHPLMPKDVRIHGFLIHPDTGFLDVVSLEGI